MAQSCRPFLMFEGQAEDAMNFYTSLFGNSGIDRIERWKEGEPGAGTIKTAEFSVAGTQFLCSDSPMPHGFTFTPSSSIFVDCESEEELRSAFERISEGGEIMMPIGDYGFSRLFGWTADRFGVSWQLNLP